MIEYDWILKCMYPNSCIFNDWSILGVEEGEKSFAQVSQKVVKFLLGIEFISLIQCGIIIADVFEYFLIEVCAERGDYSDDSTDNCNGS